MAFSLDSLIEDRETNRIHVMKVMGLKPSIYWLANLFVDTFSVLPIIAGCLIMNQIMYSIKSLSY